ncbi:multidrug resistance protein ypnp-related [Anaeramoeba flamelloides]|uniref:Multidrug resistance protein ypnp-related n=1 Tax=Anaeramoeba flamelloides TaxID=1746091 RepID=A0AAV7ZLE5_9EUKA|nr:multidrug resistance protein ypnp-related [Anaeramoeba flamelloides]KAJ6243395.1 multidrug resistance protein ypnp-related [Anaeramoeba flamelloides]
MSDLEEKLLEGEVAENSEVEEEQIPEEEFSSEPDETSKDVAELRKNEIAAERKKKKNLYRFLGVLMCFLGAMDFVTSFAEKSAIIRYSEDDYLIYKICRNIMGWFTALFSSFNSGVLNLISVRQTSALNSADKLSAFQEIGQVFQVGIGLSVLFGVLSSAITLSFLRGFFSFFRHKEYYSRGRHYMYLRAPLLLIEFINSTMSGSLTGLLRIIPLFVIVTIETVGFISLVFILTSQMDDTLMAVGIANSTFDVLVTILFLIYLFRPKMRKLYGITNFKGSKRGIIKITTSTFLLLANNIIDVTKDTLGTIFMASISKRALIGSEAVDGSFDFLLSLGTFISMIANIVGTRIAVAKDYNRYIKLLKTLGRMLLGFFVVSYIILFAAGLKDVSIKSLSNKGTERDQVTEYANKIWVLALIHFPFKLILSTLTMLLINFEKYFIIAISSLAFSVALWLPVTLINVKVYHTKLFGIKLAGFIFDIAQILFFAFLLFFRLIPNLKKQDKGSIELKLQNQQLEKEGFQINKNDEDEDVSESIESSD